jgi:HSP20 family protein
MSTDKWRFNNMMPPFRPVRELEEMRRRFDEDISRPLMRAVWEHIPEEMKTWGPNIDVFEKDDNVVVKVELPGVKQEDIEVFFSNDTLTVKGERATESGIKNEDYHRSEIAYGAFSRTVPLPTGLDINNIDAVYANGILRITLQRTSGAKPQKIAIKVKEGT